jgi:autotransporter-associated beta strand protein
MYAAGLPDYFDWRLTDPTQRGASSTDAIVGKVRNQIPYQNCWSFATTASLESSINLQRQNAGLGPIERLSERYLSWLTWAPPLDGGGDGFVFGDIKEPAQHTFDVYGSGDTIYNPVSTLVRYGVAYNKQYPYVTDYNDNTMEGIQSLAGNGVALHDNFNLQAFEILPETGNVYPTTNLNKNIEYYKKMLQTYGVLRVNYAVNAQDTSDEEMKKVVVQYNICDTTPKIINHAVTIVGWDDNYTMTIDGVTHKGAWLMRNSWGTEYKGTPVGVDSSGYFYLAYDDATVSAAVYYNAETDWGRYTTVNTAAPAGQNLSFSYDEIDKSHPEFAAQGSYKTASKLASNASQILKAVGIFVPADSMTYKIEVSLKSDTPANTTTIYTQNGTFGEDGTAMYKGYRTVDFDKFVYLPSGQKYFVTVTLTGTDGTTYYIPISDEDNKNLTAGTSFLYDATTGAWNDVQTLMQKTTVGIPLYALSKYSREANGGDFTVVSLNDNGAGGSGIYLGKKDELYTTDLLHPVVTTADGTLIATGTPRYTLSNMTVDLAKGLTDSVYGGVISGEGQVIKTGDGMLALSGANTYTGATSVNAGSLALTGSLLSPVTVANGATFTGNGTINGNLTNSGTLVPGLTAEARNLFTAAAGGSGTTTVPQVGTLTVNGNFTSNGKLIVATNGTNISKLAVSGGSTLTGTALSVIAGGTNPLVNHKYNYLTSQGGITGNVTTEDATPYLTFAATVDGNNAYVTANQKNTLGGLNGMTTSENSVGAALNKALLNHIANNPNAASTAEMNSLLYQDAAASQASIKQITNVTLAQLITVSPLTAMTTGATYDRLDTALYDGNVNVAVPTASFDGVPATLQVAAPMTLDTTNNLWFKLLRGFESYGGTDGGYDLDNKSFGGVIGYDRAVNGTTRVGGLLSYAKTDYSTDVMSGDSHDWRIGIYASHDNGTWKTQGLISYGQNKYDFNRYIAYDNSKLSSDYTAKVFDMDLKVKYLPQYNRAKSWQVAPYVGLAYTHSTQGAYAEDGSSAFAQNIDSASNNSYRAEVGVEWKHAMNKDSSFGGSVGYKRVLSGVNPELNGTFVGDDNRFTLKTDNDRNYFTYSLNLRKNTGHNWTVQGDVRGEKSSHNHSEVYSIMAKYAF